MRNMENSLVPPVSSMPGMLSRQKFHLVAIYFSSKEGN
jgi:hypothetical protein